MFRWSRSREMATLRIIYEMPLFVHGFRISEMPGRVARNSLPADLSMSVVHHPPRRVLCLHPLFPLAVPVERKRAISDTSGSARRRSIANNTFSLTREPGLPASTEAARAEAIKLYSQRNQPGEKRSLKGEIGRRT